MMGAIKRWYDTVTASLAGMTTTLNNKVTKTGDTMTGDLAISATGGSSGFTLNKAAAGYNQIFGNTGGVQRWLLRLGSPDAGSNNGADFELHRYADNGSYLGAAMTINRASGSATFAQPLYLNAAAVSGGQATRKDYVDQRDTDTYNAAWANITGWAAGQDSATYNNATAYTRSYAVAKSGDTMSGPLSFTGGMAVVNNSGASRHYYQFMSGVAWVYEIDNGRMAYVHPGSPSGYVWKMEGPCYCDVSWVGGHGAYVDLSDASLKEQIAPACQGLDEVLRLQPKTFVRKPRFEGLPQREELGFVAQDVQAVLPHAVVEVDTKEGPLLGVASEAIVAAMVTAFKQIDERLKAGGL